MGLDTILFDLDGTLLPFEQATFLEVYLNKLGAVFHGLGLDPKSALKALWAGTEAMQRNDGGALNCARFWATFSAHTALSDAQLRTVEDACDRFYSGAFDEIKSILQLADPTLPRRMVHSLTERGYTVALATNPLFPTCAVTTRLAWIGLTPDDFCLVTDYSNSRFCKPNPAYYEDIFHTLGKSPQQCLMVGNNAREDMSAGQLGTQLYLVTDFLENEGGIDPATFPGGTLSQAAAFLAALPSLR